MHSYLMLYYEYQPQYDREFPSMPHQPFYSTISKKSLDEIYAHLIKEAPSNIVHSSDTLQRIAASIIVFALIGLVLSCPLAWLITSFFVQPFIPLWACIVFGFIGVLSLGASVTPDIPRMTRLVALSALGVVVITIALYSTSYDERYLKGCASLLWAGTYFSKYVQLRNSQIPVPDFIDRIRPVVALAGGSVSVMFALLNYTLPSVPNRPDIFDTITKSPVPTFLFLGYTILFGLSDNQQQQTRSRQ